MFIIRKTQMIRIWMKVTKDELELPEAVAGSALELAEILGIKENTIYKAMNRAKNRGEKCRFIRVKCEDDENETT